MTHAWFDISAGVAGDMLLGSLVDAGAAVDAVQRVLDALVPGSVRLETEEAVRGGQRGTKVRVRVLVDDPPHRTWASIRDDLSAAAIPDETRRRALDAFGRLAEAEARVHGTAPDEVHFHEVGALDSIADVVGVCEAVRLLGVDSVSAGPVAVGDGRVHTAHGNMPVPVPAVGELVRGWQVVPLAAGTDGRRHSHEPGHDRPAEVATPGAPGELATPTGVALIRALATACEPLPAMTVGVVGVGAGGRDFAGHPNVVRVVLGRRPDPGAVPVPVTPERSAELDPPRTMTELMANVDDLDPRVWPSVLDACLAAGAADAWLVPIHMKKGRPGFTIHALAGADSADAVADVVLTHTSTLGVREVVTHRRVLDRTFVVLALDGVPLTVKVGSRDGRVVHAAAELSSMVEVAEATGRPLASVAQGSAAAIVAAGLTPGAEATADATRLGGLHSQRPEGGL